MKKMFIAVVLLAVLTGCDAYFGKMKALGSSAHVVCYSGGKTIYDGYSTGKIKSEADSDGYFFIDKKTKATMEVSGNCIIEYQ